MQKKNEKKKFTHPQKFLQLTPSSNFLSQVVKSKKKKKSDWL